MKGILFEQLKIFRKNVAQCRKNHRSFPQVLRNLSPVPQDLKITRAFTLKTWKTRPLHLKSQLNLIFHSKFCKSGRFTVAWIRKKTCHCKSRAFFQEAPTKNDNKNPDLPYLTQKFYRLQRLLESKLLFLDQSIPVFVIKLTTEKTNTKTRTHPIGCKLGSFYC